MLDVKNENYILNIDSCSGFYFIVMGCFCFSYYVRMIFLPSGAVSQLNYFALLGNLWVICSALNSKHAKVKMTLSIAGTISIILMAILLVRVQINVQGKFSTLLLCLVQLILPITVLYFQIDVKYFYKVFYFTRKWINIVASVMFGMLLIDLVTNRAAWKLFANLTKDIWLISLTKDMTIRIGSIFGHYIATAEIYIIYYIINMADLRYFHPKGNKKSIIYMIVAGIGIAMTVSKTNTCAFLLLIIIFNIRNIKYFVSSIILVLAGYFSGIFDAVINRFMTTDLSTGRNDMWHFLVAHGYINFHLFSGMGAYSSQTLSDVVPYASAAFEYPFLKFSYEFGLVFTALLYLLAFIVPLIRLIQEKNWNLVGSFVILSIIVNTYNGIGLYRDFFYTYVIIACLIMGLSHYLTSQREEKKYENAERKGAAI